MKPMLVYPIAATEAVRYAVQNLVEADIPIVDHPTPDVTHLLLDIPSFTENGNLRSGKEITQYLQMLPSDITIVGGNLNHPALSEYRTVDFLQDSRYLAMNAAITADCALRVAAPLLSTSIWDTPTLIIGWGRIGKCLVRLLQGLGCNVTVAARKETDRATLQSLGIPAVDMDASLHKFRLIFNTAPEPVLERQITQCRNCIKIDLASRQGLKGDDVILARALPGKMVPESSGRQIAETFLRLCKEETR